MQRPPDPTLPERLRTTLVRNDLEHFLDLIAEDLPGSPANTTRKNYLSAHRTYLKWALHEHRSVLHATPEDAHAYTQHLNHKHHGNPASVVNHLARLRKLYDILHHHGAHSGPNPFQNIQGPTQHPEDYRQYYESDEIQRLLAHATTQGKALILLGAHAGLTGPEVLALKWEDLDTTGGKVHVRGREIQASQELHRALRDYGKTHGHTDLFTATGKVFDYKTDYELRGAVYRLCQAANVEYKAWHPLRNSAGLRLLKLTGDAHETLATLGLTDIDAIRPLQKRLGKTRTRKTRPT